VPSDRKLVYLALPGILGPLLKLLHPVSKMLDVASYQVSVAGSGTAAGSARRPAIASAVVVGNPIRILIVEQQQLVADALEALLSMQPGMVVVGNFGSVVDSSSRAQEMNPDILILAYRSNDGMSADTAMAISQAGSEAKVIFLTNDERDNVLLAAIEAGASAVLYKSEAAAEVIDAIRVVADGGSLIPPSMIAKVLHGRRLADGVRDSLTSRETEILRMMSDGTSNRDIATRLGISYTTVRSHIRNLSGKLAAHSKLEVVMKAQQLDLVARPSTTTRAVA
jgi:two-component system, NarL family, nitrate/nitrite response regulator NarL